MKTIDNISTNQILNLKNEIIKSLFEDRFFDFKTYLNEAELMYYRGQENILLLKYLPMLKNLHLMGYNGQKRRSFYENAMIFCKILYGIDLNQNDKEHIRDKWQWGYYPSPLESLIVKRNDSLDCQKFTCFNDDVTEEQIIDLFYHNQKHQDGEDLFLCKNIQSSIGTYCLLVVKSTRPEYVGKYIIGSILTAFHRCSHDGIKYLMFSDNIFFELKWDIDQNAALEKWSSMVSERMPDYD